MRTSVLLALGLSAVPLFTMSMACSDANDPKPKGSGGAGTSTTSTSESTSDATTATGAGGGVDHGAPSDVYPAFQPAPPTMVKLSGSVITLPKVVPVLFDGDDQDVKDAVSLFTSQIGTSTFWAATTSEYGIGPMDHGPAVHVNEAPSGTLDDSNVQDWLRNKLESGDPAFPVADGSTIFLIPYPAGVTLTQGGGTGCVQFAGYHNSITLDAAHGSVVVPYAVLPRCSPFLGLTKIGMVTAGASHELIEAVTDPQPEVSPAYEMFDDEHAFWIYALGAETGDVCSGNPASYIQPPGIDFTVQRCWSNKSASMLHDPCAPSHAGAPYFNTAAVLPDDFKWTTYAGTTVHSKVVDIPVGESRVVELDLFSDAKTSGPWTVTVADLAKLYGMPAQLDIKLDRNIGVNGEKIYATITALKPSGIQPSGLSLFEIYSDLGTTETVWAGGVRSVKQ